MTLTQISSRGVEDTLRWSLGASGTDHYTFTGPGLTGTVNDPTIYLSRGQTYIFENNNSSNAHPFQIQSTSGQGGTAYNTGVTNNGGAGGTEIKITVPHDAPDNLYYQCTAHPNMGGTIFITGAVADGSITSNKIADGTITSTDIANNTITNADINSSAAIAGSKIDPTFTGTGGVKLPVGTTLERVNTTGLLRFNSELGLPEFYNGTEWKIIDTPPTITSVSPTEVDSTAGGNVTFTINGARFNVGALVKFVSNNSTQLTPTTVTRVSSSQLTAVIAKNSFVNAQEPYDVKVINSSGLSATLDDQINVDQAPSWTTSAGNLATISDSTTGTHATLAATDADGDTIAYSITSGAVPAGLTLNSSTGVISGDPTDVTSSTTSNFTATATAAGKTINRAFSIIVTPTFDGSTSAKAAGSPQQIATVLGSTPTNGTYWFTNSGIDSGTPFQAYCDWSIPYFNSIGLMILQQGMFSAGTGSLAQSDYTNCGTAGTTVTGTRGHGNTFRTRPATILDNWSGDTANRATAMMYANNGNIGSNLNATASLNWVQFNVTPNYFKEMFDNTPSPGQYVGTVTARGWPASSTTNGFASSSTTGAFYWSKNSSTHEYSIGHRQMSSTNTNTGWNGTNYIEIKDQSNTDPNHGWFVAGDGGGQYCNASGSRNYTFARSCIFGFSPNNIRS